MDNRSAGLDINAYTKFLKEIGYLVPEGGDFAIDTRMSMMKSPVLPARNWLCR